MTKKLIGELELNRIYQMDCIEGMRLLPDNSIDITITSPPYNVGIEYDNHKDHKDYNEYLTWIREVFSEVYRVTKSGGRVCVNIAMESNKGGKKYLMNDYINLLEDIGFIRNSMALWVKNQVTSRTAWGSYKSPSCPNIINPSEVILVYSKDTRKKAGDKSLIDITKEEFVEYSLGVWQFKAESAKRIGHPAPFPEELPYRCMKMFSYVGDVVLDPFIGSGTTAKAALLNNRHFIGFEISAEYVDIANRRIKDAYTRLQTKGGE